MWVAYILIGLIATGDVSMTAGPHPFNTTDACDAYISDVLSTIKALNSRRPEDQQMMMVGGCFIQTTQDAKSTPLR